MKIFYTFLAGCIVVYSCKSFQPLDTNSTSTRQRIIYSSNVGDSFDIYITTAIPFDSNRNYNVIYYLDANLKSGKKIRELIGSGKYDAMVSNNIFVGIGHIGDYRVLRRRDLVIPSIVGKDTLPTSVNFGHAENFYRFLKDELIPTINNSYKTNQRNNSIVGHSFGGLFVFYCLFKNEQVFSNYYALSPSLWMNAYEIYSFDNRLQKNETEQQLYFSAGSLELLNYVKRGADNMKRYLDSKNYPHLHYIYQVHEWETHNSQVEKSLEFILRQDSSRLH